MTEMLPFLYLFNLNELTEKITGFNATNILLPEIKYLKFKNLCR